MFLAYKINALVRLLRRGFLVQEDASERGLLKPKGSEKKFQARFRGK